MDPVRHATRLLTLTAALSCLIAPLAGQAQCGQSHFTVIDAPGVSSTVVTGLNNQGQVIGSYWNDSGITSSFVWRRGRFTNLTPSADVLTLNANSINDRGQIVGQQYSTDTGQGSFFYDRGRFTHIDNPNAVYGLTFAKSINNQGQIAGFFVDSNFSTCGFVYQKGSYQTVKVPVSGATSTAINAISDNGQIAGYYVAPQPDGSFVTQAFLSVRGKFTPLTVPGSAGFSIATGVNNQGQVVGYYLASDFGTHGFLYSKGRYTTFDAPVIGEQGTYPGGINEDGAISGEFVDANYLVHGFLLSNEDDDDSGDD